MGFYMYLLAILKLFFCFCFFFIPLFAQAGVCLLVEGKLISFDKKELRFRTEEGWEVRISQEKISSEMVKSLKKRRLDFKKQIKECFPVDSMIYYKKINNEPSQKRKPTTSHLIYRRTFLIRVYDLEISFRQHT